MPQLLKATSQVMVWGTPPGLRRAMLALGSCFMAAALAWPGYLLVQGLRVRLAFRQTVGRIVVSKRARMPHWDHARGQVTPVRVTYIRYEYEAGGLVYQNDRVAPGLPGAAPELAQRFPAGSQPIVYVNRRQPREAYLTWFYTAAAGLTRRFAAAWACLALLAVAAVMLARRALSARRLELDLDRMVYVRRRGWLWAPRCAEGPFDDLKGLLFTREVRGYGRATAPVWVLSLLWHSGDSYHLGEWPDVEEARELLVDLLKKLDLPVVDPATGQEVMRKPDDHDPNLRERTGEQEARTPSTPAVCPPPEGGKILCSREGSEIRFVMPPLFHGLTRIVIAVSYVACLLLLQTAGDLVPAKIDRVVATLGMFWLAGIALVIVLGGVREVIVVGPESIERRMHALGLSLRRRVVQCRDVREVWFDGLQVLVRSDEKVLRIDAGQRLRATDKHWMAGVLRAAARGQADLAKVLDQDQG